MKRFLISWVTLLACASCLPSVASAEKIECASEASSARGGHWYYRIIDGRKCWYQGKALIPKSSLYWPNAAVAEVEPARTEQQETQPAATDGRNVSAPPEPAPLVWPTPESSVGSAPVNDISFESRWLGLRSSN